MANAATIQLAALLRNDGNEINVPRSLDDDECASLLQAGLISETGVDDERADRRYEATDLARDVIWGRVQLADEETPEERKKRLNRERQARFNKKDRPPGFVNRVVLIHPDDWKAIKALEQQLRAAREKDAQSNKVVPAANAIGKLTRSGQLDRPVSLVIVVGWCGEGGG